MLIDLDNREGLLKPGMNAEVELVVADRTDVLTIPNAALRTPADVHVAGGVVGLSTEQVDAMLAASTLPPRPGSSEGGTASGPGGMSEEDQQMLRSIMTKRRNGEELNEEEQAFQRKMMQQFARRGGSGRGGPRAGAGGGPRGGPPGGGFGGERPRSASIDSQFGGDFIVYALRDEQPVAVRVRTGVTDLDRTEIVLGLERVDPVFHLTHGLDDASRGEPINPRRYGGRTWFDHARHKLAMFTVAEVRAIIAYLGLCRGKEMYRFDQERIDQALTNYWRQRVRELE